MVQFARAVYGFVRNVAVPDATHPFSENEELALVRDQARKLATTRLTLAISGEAGTGKRALASELMQLRCRALGAKETTWLTPDLGTGTGVVPSRLRAIASGRSVVAAQGTELLSDREQVALASLVRDGQVSLFLLTGVDRDGRAPSLHDELQALV